ncbi:HK97 family phage prohead protease [Nocardia carnea]|uniref:HK97 family phage prohead protease n=1 Tax=Nocardia carnea TaxID=37328 RepID=UPI002455AEC6|nr:HK97 family phage prohead protease [Nocardia carnea]
MTILYRTGNSEPDSTGRTIHGIAVPYGQTARISDYDGEYLEAFAPGAFARSIQDRGHKIPLMVQHERRSLPIGRASKLTETDDGLHAEFLVSRTTAGDDALTLVRDGLVDSFSIGFRPIRQETRMGTVVRVEASLSEVSLVTSPAYAGALIGGVRAQDIRRLDLDTAWRRYKLEFEVFDRSDKEPYGSVEYADPGYQKDGKKRYPLDSERHVRAAWSYVNMPKNQKAYTAQQLARIKAKIKSAAKKFGIEIED